MKTLNKSIQPRLIALTIGLLFSASVMADTMTKEQYKAAENNIEADYKVAKSSCDVLAGNAKDICVAEVKGKMNVAKAELDTRNKPSSQTQYDVRVAKAEAEYAIANEKCDDKAGNDKDVCVKVAKAAKVRQTADAKAQLKTNKAVNTANEKTSTAATDANEKIYDARKDAATDKRDAEYAVAKEKCDVLAGDAKTQCVNSAKVRFGK